MKAILLISHGSKNKKCLDEIQATVDKLRQRIDAPLIEYAFLEIEEPLIPEGIEKCIHQGATEVLVLLNFLNAGRHTETDIPDIIAKSQHKHPDIDIKISSPVGQQEGIIDLFVNLINES